MEGNVIKVTGSTSVPAEFLGMYGVIKEYSYGYKWVVEFKAWTETSASLKQTVSREDFEVIGFIY